MARPNAAIEFAPEGFSTSGRRLMGRHAAGEGFLTAWLRHGGAPVLFCHARSRADVDAFTQLRDAQGRSSIPVRWVQPGDAGALGEAGTLQLPDPGLARAAWIRRRKGAANGWSLCGITHTIASHTAMDAIADYLSAPVEPWDALICTSGVVLASVRRLLAAQQEWLGERLGAAPVALPRLELIPLGVDCSAHAADPARRAAWRARLGIGERDVAFLFVGRLSFHAKANPAPMYAALEQTARAQGPGGRAIHLIQAGWFQNDAIRRAFVESARSFCPSVRMHFLDGRQAEVRGAIRQAADVFISLSDNVQETFGLTPAEAMAAGLPCIVSDWDGYRETVRDGSDGFRIPTLAAPPGAGPDLAARFEEGVDSYDRYIGNASLATSVDPQACAQACLSLANDSELRHKMGEAARRQASGELDWAVVIQRYQKLWTELAELRRAGRASPARGDPRRPDPFSLFSEYPTKALSGGERVELTPDTTRARLRELLQSVLLGYGGELFLSEAEFAQLLERIGAAPGSAVDNLVSGLEPDAARRTVRGLAWMHKAGLLKLVKL